MAKMETDNNDSVQTASKLYLVLDFVNGGHLFFQLYRQGIFDEDLARLYTAELVLAIAHLHALGIAHRDLKPVSSKSLSVHTAQYMISKALSSGPDMQQGSIMLQQHRHFKPAIVCQQRITESCTQNALLRCANANRLLWAFSGECAPGQ